MQTEALTYETPNLVEFQGSKSADDFLPIQRIKNEVAKRLLETWMADESGYDERMWEIAKKTIEENRLSIVANRQNLPQE